MDDTQIDRCAEQFCTAWQGLIHIYEDYARTVNVPYTTLYVLSLIAQTEGCTQKDICERSLTPKQTVNTIITGLYNQQMVELRQTAEDRRVKTVHLTEKGRAFAAGVLPQIRQAEHDAMASLTDEQRRALLEGIRCYGNAFRSRMLQK